MNTKIRILVVDDDTMVQKVMGNFCKKIPEADLTVAGDGLTAINIVTNDDKFDIIFMDTNMPGISGFEATSKIRLLEKGKDVQIIALSGDDVEKADLDKYGYNSYSHKPMPKKVFEGYISEIKK